MARRSLLALSVALLLVGPTLPFAAGLEGSTRDIRPEGCAEDLVDHPALGLACVATEGGYLVSLHDGTTIRTHGPDPAPEGEERYSPGEPMPAAASGSRPPACVREGSTESRIHLIYATRAVDNYAAAAPSIRNMMIAANERLAKAADPFGVAVSYRVLCDENGVIMVERALGVPNAFGEIVSSLRARGYNSELEKYWVWYDGESNQRGVAGTAQIPGGDSASPDNPNNRGNTYGVTYGYGEGVMSHEGGHTLGAVQWSAPHSTGAGHCNDGIDLMCYNDGGPNGRQTYACTSSWYDCNNDDYFNPLPAPGSYLATHWNIGASYDRFLLFCGSQTAGANAALCSIDAPRWVPPGGTLTGSALVRFDGPDTSAANLEIVMAGATTIVPIPGGLADDDLRRIPFEFQAPAAEGWYDVRVRIVAAEDDTPGDDERSLPVRVVDPEEPLRVGVVRSAGWRWLADEWYRVGDRPVEITTLMGSFGLSDLREAGDILIVGDTDLIASEQLAIEEYLLEGHGALGAHRLLSSIRAENAPLRPLFGLDGNPTAYGCSRGQAPRTLVFAGVEALLREGLPAGDRYSTNMTCGVSAPFTLAGASLEAKADEPSASGLLRIHSYRHDAVGKGAGAALYFTYDVGSAGSVPEDEIRVLYNGLRWLRSRTPLAIDRAIVDVYAPPIVCAGRPFLVEARVGEYGTQTAPATTFTVRFDNAVVTTLSVPALDPTRDGGARASFTFTVPFATTSGAHTLRLEVGGTDEAQTANNAREVSLTVATCESPERPYDLKAEPGPGVEAMKLTWNPPYLDGGAPILRYRIFRSSAGSEEAEIGRAMSSPFLDTGLDAATAYTYRVAAEHGGGVGGKSAAVTAHTYSAIPPAAPDLEIRQDNEALDILTKASPSNGGPPATSYRLYRSAGAAPPAPPPFSPEEIRDFGAGEELVMELPPGGSHRDYAVIPGKYYSYRLIAVNEIGWSDPSNYRWAQVTQTARGTAAVMLGGQGYVFGGYLPDETPATGRVLRYDPATGSVTQFIATHVGARTRSAAVAAEWPGCPEGCALIFGGEQDPWSGGPNVLRNDIVKFDPKDGSTARLARRLTTPMGAGLSLTSAVWDDTRHVAYLFGGTTAVGGTDNGGGDVFNGAPTRTANVLRFNPATESLDVVAALPTPRTAMAAVWDSDEDVAYIFGGVTGQALDENGESKPIGTDQILRFDPALGIVTILPVTLPETLWDVAATWDGDHAYLHGGFVDPANAPPHGDTSGRSHYTLRFDPTAMTITQMRSYRTSSDASAVWDGNWSVVFGESTPNCAIDYCRVAWKHHITPRAIVATASVDAAARKVTLSWNAPDPDSWTAITSYVVYRDGVRIHETTNGATMAYADTVPEGRRTYRYEVTAVNEGRDEGDRRPTDVWVAGTPWAPRSTTASTGPGLREITLSWRTPATDGGLPITGYSIWRGPTATNLLQVKDVGTSTTTWKDTGLADDTWYHYAVKAMNAAGASEPSEVAAAKTFAPRVAGAPEELAVAPRPNYGQMALTWTRPNDEGEPGLTGYRVYLVKADGSTTLVGTPAITSFTHTGLVPSTAYTYEVAAVNPAGIGPRTQRVTSTTSDAGTAAAPANIVATPSETQADRFLLTWDAPAANGNPTPTAYDIYVRNEATGSTTKISVSDVRYREIVVSTPSGAYTIQMRSLNANGAGPYSATVTTDLHSPASAPQGLNACRALKSATLQWSAPADDGGRPITAYNIYQQTATDPSPVERDTVSGTTYTVSVYSNTGGVGTTYTVRATTSMGLGTPATVTVGATTPGCGAA